MTSGAIAGFLDVAFNFNTQALLDDNLIGKSLALCEFLWSQEAGLNIVYSVKYLFWYLRKFWYPFDQLWEFFCVSYNESVGIDSHYLAKLLVLDSKMMKT